MKNILVLVCVLFSVVSLAGKIEIPGPKGVDSHRNRQDPQSRGNKPLIARNLFDAEPDPERLKDLRAENQKRERIAAVRFLTKYNPDDFDWTLVHGDEDESVKEIFDGLNQIAFAPRPGEQFPETDDNLDTLKDNFESLCAIGISPVQVEEFCELVGCALPNEPKPTTKEELEIIFQRLNNSDKDDIEEQSN